MVVVPFPLDICAKASAVAVLPAPGLSDATIRRDMGHSCVYGFNAADYSRLELLHKPGIFTDGVPAPGTEFAKV